MALEEKERRLRLRHAPRAEAHLHTFLKHFAWPALNPATPFKDNWHIGAICEHLEAVHFGQINRLLINLPFRMLKSTIISQAFPAWEWLTSPAIQFLTASYAASLATRDAVDARRIIESDLYQEAWASRFTMTTDQNVKTFYENSRRGSRKITSTEAGSTGFGGNRVIIDDPVNAKDAANSELARLASIEWWKGTITTRLNNPTDDAIIVAHQRLHRHDLTGHILDNEEGDWVHLVIPMRFEKIHRKTTSLGFVDPRTKDGELLHVERLPEDTVTQMERRLGPYHTAAQLQQSPSVRGGGVFESGWFIRYSQLPKIIRRRFYADTAQKTKEENDYSVFQIWGLGDDGKIYLLDQLRGKWEAWELEQKAIDFWNKHRALQAVHRMCSLSKMMVEDKSSGTGLVQDIRKKGKIPVFPIQRDKDKLTRAYDGQPFIQAGFVCIPETASWVSDYCREFDDFTKSDQHDHDDQIDPTLDAIDDLLGPMSHGNSMMEIL